MPRARPPDARREHPLPVESLVERVLADERFELTDHLLMRPQRELGVDTFLERAQPQLLEPLRLTLEVDVRERGPAPERQRFPEQARRTRGLGAPGLRPQRLEAVQVDRFGRNVERIARVARRDRVVAERLAQAGDVDVQRGHGRRRRRVAPQFVDELLGGDDAAGIQ
jgi:hypothetical protein